MKTSITPAVWFPAIRAGSGTDVFTERLVEGLCQRGLQAEISWLPHRAEYAPWTVAELKPPAWANIAHVNTWLPQKFIPDSLPFVATMHGCVHDAALEPYKRYSQALYHRFWVKKIERRVLNHAKQVTAVSHYTARQTQKTYSVTNIEVIHNGIRLDGVFQPEQARQEHRPFRLLYVGNWSLRKGTDLLMPIMRQLGLGFELYYTADRDKACSTAKMASNVHSLGRLDSPEAMARAYREADALLFPTRLEGLPLVVLEAYACGLPVIATKGSSLPEVIDDGKTGLLCPQDDVAAFVNAARRLANDFNLWQRMGNAARARVEEYFGIDAMIEHYIAIYEKVLANS